jgi:hypothetical protein
MSSRPRDRFEENAPTGFTVMLCDACGDGEPPDLSSLRQTVRRTSHGMLVRVHCLLGRMWCRTREASGNRGVVLLLQRCTTGRRPLGSAILVGPVRTVDDFAAVARWLDETPMDADLLPAHLTTMVLGCR